MLCMRLGTAHGTNPSLLDVVLSLFSLLSLAVVAACIPVLDWVRLNRSDSRCAFCLLAAFACSAPSSTFAPEPLNLSLREPLSGCTSFYLKRFLARVREYVDMRVFVRVYVQVFLHSHMRDRHESEGR